MGIALTVGSIVVFFVLVFTVPWPEEEEVAQSRPELAKATSQPTAAIETNQVVVNALPVATAGCLSTQSEQAAAEFAHKIAVPTAQDFNCPSRLPGTRYSHTRDFGFSNLAYLLENHEVDNLWFDVVARREHGHPVLRGQNPGRMSTVRVVPSPASVVSALSVAPNVGRSLV